MYYNPYLTQSNYLKELYNMQDKISNQIRQAENQQPTSLTQNFQISPAISNFRIVTNMEDAQKEVVIADTYFLANDKSNLWIKNVRGDIETYKLEKVVIKDEKDELIEKLQKQIEEMKGSVVNGNTTNDRADGNTRNDESVESTRSEDVSIVSTSKAE